MFSSRSHYSNLSLAPVNGDLIKFEFTPGYLVKITCNSVTKEANYARNFCLENWCCIPISRVYLFHSVLWFSARSEIRNRRCNEDSIYLCVVVIISSVCLFNSSIAQPGFSSVPKTGTILCSYHTWNKMDWHVYRENEAVGTTTKFRHHLFSLREGCIPAC